MSRPTIDPDAIQSGLEGWDALIRDIVNAISNAPFPIKRYQNVSALPSAANYDHCLVATIDEENLYFSRAGVWKRVTVEA